jgi:hypothetical protein
MTKQILLLAREAAAQRLRVGGRPYLGVVVERGENCHRNGPSLSSSRNTPEAKKLASGVSMSRNCFIWVMKRLPLTAKMKPSGVSSCQRAKDSGRCSE